jgi:hypothetical protein
VHRARGGRSGAEDSVGEARARRVLPRVFAELAREQLMEDRGRVALGRAFERLDALGARRNRRLGEQRNASRELVVASRGRPLDVRSWASSVTRRRWFGLDWSAPRTTAIASGSRCSLARRKDTVAARSALARPRSRHTSSARRALPKSRSAISVAASSSRLSAAPAADGSPPLGSAASQSIAASGPRRSRTTNAALLRAWGSSGEARHAANTARSARLGAPRWCTSRCSSVRARPWRSSTSMRRSASHASRKRPRR